MRNLLSFLIRRSGAGCLLKQRSRNDIPVLCFHRITDETDPIWPSVRIKVFREIIAFCSKHYDIILPEQVHEALTKPKMIITFDDGFGDFIENALPILYEVKVKTLHTVVVDSVLQNRPNWTFRLNQIITYYLQYKRVLSFREYNVDFEMKINAFNAPSASVRLMLLLKNLPFKKIEIILQDFENAGKSTMQFPKMMNKEELLQCESGGVQIGSHGYSHILLSQSLGEQVLQKEIVESKLMLEKLLMHRVSSFAFPAGCYDKSVTKVAALAGYEFLFAAGDDFFSLAGSASYPLIFPRIIPPTSGTDEVILKIEGFHAHLKNLRKSA